MRLQGKKVLVVDDDEILRRLLRKILENSGLSVAEASDPREAIQALQESSPDLIILDLFMPGADGFDFLRFRTKIARLNKIPVLVLSAVNRREEMAQVLGLGAEHFISKPLNAKVVLQKIRQTLYGQEPTTHKFHNGELPTATATISAVISIADDGSLKISSNARFAAGEPLGIEIKNSNAGLIIVKVTDQRAEFDDGLYVQKALLDDEQLSYLRTAVDTQVRIGFPVSLEEVSPNHFLLASRHMIRKGSSLRMCRNGLESIFHTPEKVLVTVSGNATVHAETPYHYGIPVEIEASQKDAVEDVREFLSAA